MRTAWEVVSASSRTLTLYHGTTPEKAAQIEREGLKPNEAVPSATWFMLTTSLGQAERYGHGAVVVVEVPEDRVWHHGAEDALLWPGQPHPVYGFESTAYALKQTVPASMVAEVLAS